MARPLLDETAGELPVRDTDPVADQPRRGVFGSAGAPAPRAAEAPGARSKPRELATQPRSRGEPEERGSRPRERIERRRQPLGPAVAPAGSGGRPEPTKTREEPRGGAGDLERRKRALRRRLLAYQQQLQLRRRRHRPPRRARSAGARGSGKRRPGEAGSAAALPEAPSSASPSAPAQNSPACSLQGRRSRHRRRERTARIPRTPGPARRGPRGERAARSGGPRAAARRSSSAGCVGTSARLLGESRRVWVEVGAGNEAGAVPDAGRDPNAWWEQLPLRRAAIRDNVELIRLQLLLREQGVELAGARARLADLRQAYESRLRQHREAARAAGEALLARLEELARRLAEETRRAAALERRLPRLRAQRRALEESRERIRDLEKERDLLKEDYDELLRSSLRREEPPQEPPAETRQQPAALERERAARTLSPPGCEALERQPAGSTEREEGVPEEPGVPESPRVPPSPRASAEPEPEEPLAWAALQRKVREAEAAHAETALELEKTRDMLILQHRINRDYQAELESAALQAERERRCHEEEQRQKARLLDLRAARIQQLEGQLRDVAYGARRLPVPPSGSAADEAPAPRDGEALLELHVAGAALSEEALRRLGDARALTFCTYGVYDFETHCTPLAPGPRPRYGFTSRYLTPAEPLFLRYLHDSAARLELHWAAAAEHGTLASCWLRFGRALGSGRRVHATATLRGRKAPPPPRFRGGKGASAWQQARAGERGEARRRACRPLCPPRRPERPELRRAGVLDAAAAAGGAPESFGIPLGGRGERTREDGVGGGRAELLPSPGTALAFPLALALPLPQAPVAEGARNELRVRLTGCAGLRARRPGARPSPYAVYRFFAFPDHDTRVVPASGRPRFDDLRAFPLRLTAELRRYLRLESLRVYVFDDDEAEAGAYLGKAEVPLLPLARGHGVAGDFALTDPCGNPNGTISLSLEWGHRYAPTPEPEPCPGGPGSLPPRGQSPPAPDRSGPAGAASREQGWESGSEAASTDSDEIVVGGSSWKPAPAAERVRVEVVSLRLRAPARSAGRPRHLYVDYRFPGVPAAESETPLSLREPRGGEEVFFHCSRVIRLDGEAGKARRELLFAALRDKEAGGSRLRFAVVSEPPAGAGGECEEVGCAWLDLAEMLRTGRDALERELEVFSPAAPGAAIGGLKVSVEAAAALRAVYRQGRQAECRAGSVPALPQPAAKTWQR
ncbi:X-linked retinitis pigmentosa GTPase regulator-interacting protein 1 [Struthio camelus]|uniref:X-linked retinitis pigmentosa GTPase regulator-interacting protein 1 n=1 Tax=Struthio camelus TaxID=8801 RepID=UPI003603DF96